MSNAYFAFRQFGIRQDRCGMKISMDACIFGAWIPFRQKDELRILDIGAGTGLLSLMLAQRFPSALVDAVEIDQDAAAQADENIGDSIFRDRIQLVHGDARSFSSAHRYDLIVSNPPFFSRSVKGPDNARNLARHDDGLDLLSLFTIVANTLAADGQFALLMPSDAEGAVLQVAASCGLLPVRRMDIRERQSSRPKRSCWVFSRNGTGDKMIPETCMVRDGESYADAFRNSLDPFYLRL